MLASTKHWRQQNICVDKILASTKYWRRQNIGIDKILASTKYLRWQNIGVDRMLAPARKHLLTVLAQQNSQQLTFPRPNWCSPTSPWRCWALHVQSPSVLLPPAALLLWVDSLPHCTGLFVLARHAENVTNIGVDKISALTKISITIAVSISAHRRPIKHWWKQKVITITV
jgi:hypothetical protein